MIGRGQELQEVHDAFAHAVHDRSCRLVTVLGSAGVGESRLAAEFLAERIRASCAVAVLPTATASAYWPVVGFSSRPDAAGRMRQAPARLPGERRDRVGPGDRLGFRKLLEQEAQAQPLIYVFDDLHWAEKTLLELVGTSRLPRERPDPRALHGSARNCSSGGRVGEAAGGTRRPSCSSRSTRRESAELLAALGDAPQELHERIVDAAEGNPLFLEEMLALVRESPDGNVDVPPTIQALLAARLDQLEPAERSVLERGSIEEEPSTAAPSPRSPSGSDRSTSRCSSWCARSSSDRTGLGYRRSTPTASGTN